MLDSICCCIFVAILALAVGCQKPAGDAPTGMMKTEPKERAVKVVKPKRKTIRREIGQPGYIQAFERTPIVSRIPGYVLKWNVDIGDAIHKDDVLAELWVPEMVAELDFKDQQVRQAQKKLAVTEAEVVSAGAQSQEAKAAIGRAEANINYWKSQSTRFAGLVKESVIDKQTQEETLNQYRSAAAALSEAKARLESAQAAEIEKERAREKADADIRAAEADRRRQADLVAYSSLTAPYDGIVTQRNINTKQFVQPATGAQPDVLYVVERTDIVRIFISVPEIDAEWVRVGTPAIVRVQALPGEEFKCKVTRSAWSLNAMTRTLLTEIDLPNPELPEVGRRLRPGMYSYGTIVAQKPDALTLPASAVVTEGDVNVGYQSFCYFVEDGRAKRTLVEIGARNEQLIEILKKRGTGSGDGEGPRWAEFTGDEEVIQGELSGLKDGQKVQLVP